MDQIKEKGFFLFVDRKKYGPFLDKYKPCYADLMGLCGIKFEVVYLDSGWVLPPKLPKKKSDPSTPLLEGIGFIPFSRKNKD